MGNQRTYVHAPLTAQLKAALMLCVGVVAIMLMASLAGCTPGNSGSQGASGTSNDSAQASSENTTSGPKPIRLGTLPVEDFLPAWMAADKNYFAEQGVEVQITQFQSAQELATALASGTIDGAMTDVPVAVSLTQGGLPMTLSWVTLGQTPAQGRFGIMVGPKSKVTSIQDLAKVPVGVGSATMLEYVMDSLFAQAGVAKDDIVVEEQKKVPVRFQAVMEGTVEAGVFPASLLAFGELQGAHVIADDTKGANLSQSVMAFRSDFLADPQGAQAVEGFARAWNKSVQQINLSEQGAREVLIANANLPEPLKATYPIQEYPEVAHPEADTVKAVLAWMDDKGYLREHVEYDPATGALVVAK